VIPKTLSQNLLLWCAAFALAVLLSLLSGIATHWPEGGMIDWRGVWLDVIQTIVTALPIVAAGLGLPALGKEAPAYLAHQVGQPTAVAALEQAATVQAVSDVPTPAAADLLADRIYDRIAAKLVGAPPPDTAGQVIAAIDASERAKGQGEHA
jgi:hypothetical protein